MKKLIMVIVIFAIMLSANTVNSYGRGWTALDAMKAHHSIKHKYKKLGFEYNKTWLGIFGK